ncbi:toxin-antitoxin system HicB family antitoxin [Anoxybacillus kestanbolensis]
MDPKLYEIIERWAQDEFRSVNAHIEFLLREAAKREGRLKENKK